MPVDISRLTEGWLELESDPGLFTLLLEDFGVKGVQVEEIYDLQKSLEGPVYGFIFLFRWIEERRARRKITDQSEYFVKDEDVVNNIFFAQQMVPNSCATHALLSVLLNCPSIDLGSTLNRLKAHTCGMCPDDKGWAIGNTPELAKAHNSHAVPQAKRRLDKGSPGVSSGRYTGEAYHFVSYVPIQGRLFELDGLKPFPIDHGPWGERDDWTEKFRCVITDRLGIATGEQCHDIRFNLMAVVPDRRLALTHKLKMLKTNRQIVLEALEQLVKLTNPEINSTVDVQKKEEDVQSKAAKDIEMKLSENEKVKLNRVFSTPFETNVKNSDSTSDSDSYSHPILETHNYAKIPTSALLEEDAHKSGTELTVNDTTMPITVLTSPASSSSSTDTCSEVGSALNSPTLLSGDSSPSSSKDLKKLVVVRMTGASHAEDSLKSASKRTCSDIVKEEKKICLERISEINSNKSTDLSSPAKSNEADRELFSKYRYPELVEPHAFAPKDLLALLKNLENDINTCEVNLQDENDKRKKYKIDDCRRTHNYDEFIGTFLSMLAQQGKLTELVQQHLIQQKKPGVQIKPVKMVEPKTNPPCRRRGRTRYRKRK